MTILGKELERKLVKAWEYAWARVIVCGEYMHLWEWWTDMAWQWAWRCLNDPI